MVRIAPLSQGGFLIQTRGDAEQSSEWAKVAADSKVAVAFLRIPYMGRLFEFIQSVPGIILLAVNAIVLLVVLTLTIRKHLVHSGR